MSKNFFKDLAYLCKLNKLNYDELSKKYEDIFNIGYEAGLSDKEIIKNIGTPEEIVKNIIESRKNIISNDVYDIFVDSVYISNLEIVLSDVEGISYDIESKSDLIPLVITNENNQLKIKDLKVRKYNANLKLTIYIGDNIYLNNVYLNIINGDYNIDTILAKNIKIKTIAANIDIDTLKANSIIIETISASVAINYLEVYNNLRINTISGDIDIDYVNSNTGSITSTTGVIHIDKYNEEKVNVNSVITSCTKTVKSMKSKLLKFLNKGRD